MAYLQIPIQEGNRTGRLSTKPASKETALALVKEAWNGNLGKSKDLPVYLFERNLMTPVTARTKIPPADLDENLNYLVACYSPKVLPQTITLIGVCRGSKLKRESKGGELSFSFEEAPAHTIQVDTRPVETATEARAQVEPAPPPVITIPEFFFFKGKPKLPGRIRATDLLLDLEKFWEWLRQSPWTIELAIPPRAKFDPQVLFYTLLLAVYQQLEHLIGVYAKYLEHQFMFAVPDAQKRKFFAEQHGLVISGPEEVEQKLLAIARIEAGKLRDDEDKWVGRIPRPLFKILEQVSTKWLWTPGAKKRMIC